MTEPVGPFLQTIVSRATAQTDRIEEMYRDQMKFEQERRTEQDMELSHRESKILELR